MKICMVGHFPPHIGGVSSYTYLLSLELVKRGDKVYVLTYPHSELTSNAYLNGGSVPKNNLKGIHIENAFAPNIKGLRGTIFTITASFKLMRMVKKYKIDLIHAHYIMPPGLIAVIVGKLLKTPVVLTIHGSDIFRLSRKSILKPLIRYILRNSSQIFAVSEAVKSEVIQLERDLEDKIEVTWNAVDLKKFNPQNDSSFREELNLEPGKPLILFVGNLVAQKGVKYLIEAKKFFKNDSYLVIVGSGPLQRELKAMVEYEGLKYVKFVNARDDIEKIMPQADVLVLPSTSESFGIVLLEALASGVPIVATNVGGIPEIVTGDVGIIVEPRNPVAIAEAVDKILSDPQLKSEFKSNARKRAFKYSKLEIPY